MRFEKFTDYAPLPPIDATVPNAINEYGFLAAVTIIALGGIIYALIYGRRTKSWLPIACMVGGALTTILEPLIDSHLQVWWSIHQQPTLFTNWGRDIPLFLLPAVTWYFGVGVLIRLHILKKYGARAPLWWVFGIEILMAYMIEPPAIALGLWHYYGEQGLRFFGYPIWWPFVGGACGCFAGTVLYKMEPYLQGWRQLFGILLVPMAVAAVYWAAGWPMLFALNLEPPTWVVYLMSLVSAGLAFSIVWMCTIMTGSYALKQQRKLAASTRTGIA